MAHGEKGKKFVVLKIDEKHVILGFNAPTEEDKATEQKLSEFVEREIVNDDTTALLSLNMYKLLFGVAEDVKICVGDVRTTQILAAKTPGDELAGKTSVKPTPRKCQFDNYK